MSVSKLTSEDGCVCAAVVINGVVIYADEQICHRIRDNYKCRMDTDTARIVYCG